MPNLEKVERRLTVYVGHEAKHHFDNPLNWSFEPMSNPGFLARACVSAKDGSEWEFRGQVSVSYSMVEVDPCS